MNAIRLLAPATFAISAALNPTAVTEQSRAAFVTTGAEEGRSAPDSFKATLTRTEFVGSTRERRILGCDDCGNIFSHYVTVFTLRDVFSDGTSKTRFHTVGA